MEMSDLISGSELYDKLGNKLTWLMAYGDDVYLDVGSDIKDVIDNMPTAYDIDKVVEELEERKHEICLSDDDLEHYQNGIDEAIEIVKQEAEKCNSGWILCSERLPEEAFGCLVTVMDCEPSTQTDFENILPYFVGYDGETWNDADGKEIPFEVIAWMPLPKPYKESDLYVKY